MTAQAEGELTMEDSDTQDASKPTMLGKLGLGDKDARTVAGAMGTALFIGSIVVVVAAWKIGAPNALLWAGACSAVGWIGGFLFGIPRTVADAPPAAKPAPPGPPATAMTAVAGAGGGGGSVTVVETPAPPPPPRVSNKPNTNLEQISDWLTKIIVGVTLVELNKVMAQLNAAATMIASGFNGAISFAFALMFYFSITGFLGSYLLTRLYLQKAFDRVDDEG